MTAVRELVTYARWRSQALFRRSEFEVLTERPFGLFYTGEYLFGARLAIPVREGLAKVLDTATSVFVGRRGAASG